MPAQQPFVVFAIASYTGAACHEFQGAMIETLSALAAAGISSRQITVPGDPYLSKARNRLATDFLLNWHNATHIFYIDDDVGWPAQKAVEFVRADLDVLGGVYPKKNDELQFPAQLAIEDGLPVERGGLYKAMLAPTGFLCIKRAVMERMAAAAEQYLDTTHLVDPPRCWNIFDMGWFLPDGTRPVPAAGRMGEFWGEDYYFCRRWRDMGGEVWIDPDIEFTHRGPKAWRGSMKPSIDHWLAQLKPEQKAAE